MIKVHPFGTLALISALVLLTIANVFFVERIILSLSYPSIAFGTTTAAFRGGSILFVGDIMLGRHVESLMSENGSDYPFRGVAELFTHDDLRVGNFEAAVPELHSQTPSLGMQLSAKDDSFELLKNVGFTTLSFANNHAYDFGVSAYTHAQEMCREASLSCYGGPYNEASTSIMTTQVGDVRVGTLFLHTLYGEPATTTLVSQLEDLKKKTDVRVVYIHWGEEYMLVHSPEQALFARFLIDNGADVIIGSHPHVVQDVEIYNSKPIFYSLGNFIFDQYFSDDVQTELGVRMVIHEHDTSYYLLPFMSTSTRSQPQELSLDRHEALFTRILGSVSAVPGVDVGAGSITLPR